MSRRSPEGLKEVIRDYRRDQIIDVARRLFGERGTTNVSMDEIASEAGVARSTVYVYFANRSDLLRSCLQRMYGLVQDALAQSWEQEPSARERLRALVRSLLEVVDQSPDFFRLAMATQTLADRPGAGSGSHVGAQVGSHVGAQVGAQVEAELARIALEVAHLVEVLLAQGMAEGIFRPIDPGLAAKLVGQQLFGAMTVRAAEPGPVSLDRETDEICDFVLRALAA